MDQFNFMRYHKCNRSNKWLIILSLFCLPLCNVSSAQYVVHIAGNDSCGHFGDGGLAIRASLYHPAGICLDAAGNIYIGDGSGTQHFGDNDARVRKINAVTGVITTVAGGVNLPAADTVANVAATSVTLNNAFGICIDKNGDLLIADGSSYRIRKVNLATGILTTIAGSATPGNSGDGGPATAALLKTLYGITTDSANNIYFSQGSSIRKISAGTGIISTVAGGAAATGEGDGGPATLAVLNSVHGLCIDRAGNLYLADASDARVRMVAAATGIITTVAGTGHNTYAGDTAPLEGIATSIRVRPNDVKTDTNGNLYIADDGRGTIRKVNLAADTISIYAGFAVTSPPTGIDSAGDNGPATAAVMEPTGIYFDKCGNLYFADELCRVRAVTPSLPFVRNCGDTVSYVPQQAMAGSRLQVYPDPNTGTFTICLSAAAPGPVYITITNTVGKAVKQITTTANTKEQVQASLPPGMYFINALSAEGRHSAKMVVE